MSIFRHSREIPTSAESVFAAFQDRLRLARWWGPEGEIGTLVSWVGVFENREFAEKMRRSLEAANEPNLNRLALEIASGVHEGA